MAILCSKSEEGLQGAQRINLRGERDVIYVAPGKGVFTDLRSRCTRGGVFMERDSMRFVNGAVVDLSVRGNVRVDVKPARTRFHCGSGPSNGSSWSIGGVRVVERRNWRSMDARPDPKGNPVSNLRKRDFLGRLAALSGKLSGLGLILAALFMSAALTPSLIPRSAALQGALCGISLVAGYALGRVMELGWRALDLPALNDRIRWPLLVLSSLCTAGVMAASLWLSLGWQNGIRLSMGMAPQQSGQVVAVLMVALGVAVVLVAIWRLLRVVKRLVQRRAGRFLTGPLASAMGLFAAALLFWSIGNGILMAQGMKALDNIYAALDATIQTDLLPPQDPLKTGSPASLIAWQDIGHQGRNAVGAWPAAADIAALAGSAAKEPIRVYVGLNSADDPDARAELALAELIRVGAFDRKLLVIATPTGTGWLDPAAIAPLEILHRGNVATIAVQYSYLPSWLALFVSPEYGKATARAVFRAVYGHWTSLPREGRPKLYLFGLSLGALNSGLSAGLFDVVGDPHDGALWVGPPFSSSIWQNAVAARNADSPVWRPVFQDGRNLRFANQGTGFRDGEQSDRWGPLRIGFLMYSGDPITFFDTGSLFRRPAWLSDPRAPNLPPGLRWYPVVTFLQGLLDVMTATQVPAGHGHVYAARDYLRAWADLTAPTDWTPEALARAEAALKDRNL